MPKPGFFNDNENRAYPFLEGTAGVDTPATGPITLQQLPHDWIVDCGFTIGPDVKYNDALHVVGLHRIYRRGSMVYFEFTAVSVASQLRLTFVRSLDITGYATEYLDWSGPDDGSQSSPAPSVSNTAHCEMPNFTGFLVTGKMSNLDSYLADGDEISQDELTAAIVDPTLIQNQRKTAVSGLRMASHTLARSA